MNSTQFKSEVKRIKNYLENSTMTITIISNEGTQKIELTNLRDFGNKILELEKLGFGFNINMVGNRLVQKAIHRGKKTNLDYWLSVGKWDQFYITASNLDINNLPETKEVVNESPVMTFRTKVFKRAYAIMKATGKAFAVCLSKAWALYRLAKKLRSNKEVHFTYEKKDGSLRRAIGTLKNVSQFVKGTGKSSLGVVHYFDVEAQWFRCFRVENLVSVL